MWNMRSLGIEAREKVESELIMSDANTATCEKPRRRVVSSWIEPEANTPKDS